MASKRLWFETEEHQEDLVSKLTKPDTWTMKQSFNSSFIFPCFGVGIMNVCSTVHLLFLFLPVEVWLVSLLWDDSAGCYCFRTGCTSSPAAREVSSHRTLCWLEPKLKKRFPVTALHASSSLITCLQVSLSPCRGSFAPSVQGVCLTISQT